MLVSRRPATSQDTEYARTVHHRAYRDVCIRQFGHWDEGAQDGFFENVWSSMTHEILMRSGVKCGYICVEHRVDDVYVHELVLDPDFQSQGIGSDILRGVIEHARSRRIPVRLATLRMNRATDLYRRLGFRDVGLTETHIQMEWPCT